MARCRRRRALGSRGVCSWLPLFLGWLWSWLAFPARAQPGGDEQAAGLLDQLVAGRRRGWLSSWGPVGRPLLSALLVRDARMCDRLAGTGHTSWGGRPLAYLAMGLLRCPGAQPRLWRALRLPGRRRVAALEGLAALEGRRLLPMLERALLGHDGGLARAAESALVRMGDQGVDLLARALSVEQRPARILSCLGRIGTARARSVIRRYLERHPEALGSPLGRAALYLPAGPARQRMLTRHLVAARQAGRLGEELSGLEGLWTSDLEEALLVLLGLERLSGDTTSLRRFLAHLARRPRLRSALWSLLASKKGSSRALLEAARRAGGPVALSVAGKWLDPKQPEAFVKGVRWLAVSDWAAAVEALLPHVRWTGRLGKEVLAGLGLLLRERGRHLGGPGAKRVAGRALRILRALAGRRRDPRRGAALRALAAAGDEAVVEPGLRLLSAKSLGDRIQGCLLLRNLGRESKVAEALARAARSTDPRLAACAAWGLRKKAARYAKLLERLAARVHPAVSQTAAAALAVGRGPVAALRRLRRSRDAVVARNALVGLVRRKAARPEDVLLDALETRNSLVLSALMRLLLDTWGERARPLLLLWSRALELEGRPVPAWLERVVFRSSVPGGTRGSWSGEDVLAIHLVGKAAGLRLVRLESPLGLVRWIPSDAEGWILETGVTPGRWEVDVSEQ